MNADQFRRIASFAQRYCDEILANAIADREAIRENWWRGLRFFYDRAFFQGRRDEVSARFEEAALQALDAGLGETEDVKLRRLKDLKDKGLLSLAAWHEGHPLWPALTGTYRVGGRSTRVGKSRDLEMVLDSLRFISQLDDWNLLRYCIGRIQKGLIGDLYQELQSIRQIGPKVASLFLRDLADVYELESHLAIEEQHCVFPIDTWLRQVAVKLGVKGNDGSIRNKLITTCSEYGVSAVEFNQGAWYLGAHALDILLANLERL